MTERIFSPPGRSEIAIVELAKLDIKVAVAQTEEEVEKLIDGMNSTGGKTKVSIVPVNGQFLLVSQHSDVETYDIKNPHRTGSPSEAIYLARYERKDAVVLVQYLGPNQSTSHHSHPQAAELYRKLSGELFIMCNGEKMFKVSGTTIVNPEESHIAFTTESSALTLIVQFGGNFEHIQQERPDQKFLAEQARLQGLI